MSEETEVPEGSSARRRSETASARRAALRQFYGLDAKQTRHNIASELDNPDFDAEEYVNKQLHKFSLQELLHAENEIVQEIRILEGERKALVYDNYNKLITATESIKRMRSQLKPIWSFHSDLGDSAKKILDLFDKLETHEN